MEIQELQNEVEAEKSPDISALEEDKEKLKELVTFLTNTYGFKQEEEVNA